MEVQSPELPKVLMNTGDYQEETASSEQAP